MKTITQELRQQVIYLSRWFTSRKLAATLGIGKSTVNRILKEERRNLPKILFLDVETAPEVAATFSRFDANLTQNHILREGNWLIAASWEFRNTGDNRLYSAIVTPEEAKISNDYNVTWELQRAVNQADIVVAHNAKGFDMKILKARLAANALGPHKAVKVIDTLTIAKSMKFPSNKLDSLAYSLQLGRKTTNSGIPLWIGCINGDKESLKTMKQYNRDDVSLLIEVFDQLQPYNTNTPNFGIYSDDDKVRCTHCGSADVAFTGELVYTNVGQFAEVQCNACGARSKNRQNIASKSKRKKQLGKA